MGKSKRIPASTPEAREQQLINLAVNLAEEKLLNGTASSQIITTLLNLATAKYRLEKAKIESDLRLSEAKIEHLKAQETSMEIYNNALVAFRSYQTSHLGDDEDGED